MGPNLTAETFRNT